jgi:predicted nucleic-acid-binding protein
MIGIDSNVLLRVLVGDQVRQAERAQRLLEAECALGRPAFVNRAVLVEAVWTLARGYRYSRQQLAEAVELILSSPDLVIEDREAVAEALDLSPLARADFVDVLIGALNRRAGCATTYTFDRAAQGTADFTGVP